MEATLVYEDTKRIANLCHLHYKSLKPKRKLSEWNLFVKEVYKRINQREKKKLEALGKKEKFMQLHSWYDQWQKNGTVPNEIKGWRLKRSGQVQMKKLQAKVAAAKRIPEPESENESTDEESDDDNTE